MSLVPCKCETHWFVKCRTKMRPFWKFLDFGHFRYIDHTFSTCGRKKSPPYIIIVQVIFFLFWGHWAHSGFENRIPLKPTLGGVCSLANYSVAYEETQSNRVSDFRDFVCSLFPKAIFFDVIETLNYGITDPFGGVRGVQSNPLSTQNSFPWANLDKFDKFGIACSP